jgi:hypothetical protein
VGIISKESREGGNKDFCPQISRIFYPGTGDWKVCATGHGRGGRYDIIQAMIHLFALL